MEMILSIFDNYTDVYNAIVELKEAGLTEEELSVVGQFNKDIDVEFGEEFNLITNTKQDLVDGVGPQQEEFGKLASIMELGSIMNIPELGPTMIFGALTDKLDGAASERMLGTLIHHGLGQNVSEKIEDNVKVGKIVMAITKNESNRLKEILTDKASTITMY